MSIRYGYPFGPRVGGTIVPGGKHTKVEALQEGFAQQQKNFQAMVAHQQKQIEALTAGLQKVSAQLVVSKAARRTVQNDQ